ncbi:hypothetical protein V4R08_05120 [Nitrobacter sp. NHB1]|uniref:hypothetical protein n=1 Tax=Nitrobacter sp. NHB1 TaxID=3119830 RepID=UPI002FFE4A96
MKTERRPDQAEAETLEAAVAQAIEACDGDLRATIRALLVANEFLEAQISQGYRRGVRHGRFNTYSG